MIRPFLANISEEILDDLKYRIKNTRWPDEITNSNWIPLIITHGWPGSFIEMLKLIPRLTNDEVLSYDLVIPSIIGFGYSGKSQIEGCNSEFVAHLWHKLMMELGYQKYGAQGGDIGAGVSSWLALKYPLNLIGLHLN